MKETEAAYIAGVIDGEGTITLSRMHKKEHRRPIISIASTDIELLKYIKQIVGGNINTKKNYLPEFHKDSFTLVIKNKEIVFKTLTSILPFLKVPTKIRRTRFILSNYNRVTIRNGRYDIRKLNIKRKFEEDFFKL